MNKKNIEEEISNIVDIHMHLIPGIDDGCMNEDMAVSMIYTAFLEGINKIICTPHSDAFDFNRAEVIYQFQRLKKLCQEKCRFISLFLGCEVYCRKDDIEQILRKLNEGVYPTLNDTKYVLIEFSTRVFADEVEYCVEKLRKNGWIPVLAHVERYSNLFENKNIFFRLKERGVLFQINGYSILKEMNEKRYENTTFLLHEKLVDFIGTDAHRTNHRPPFIQKGVKKMYELYDKEYINDIVSQNAINKLKLIP